jgi:hypothetical protein
VPPTTGVLGNIQPKPKPLTFSFGCGPAYAEEICVVRLRSLVAFGFAAGVLTNAIACAGRIAAPPAPGPSTEPRASWIIKAGTEAGFEREVCRSDRDQRCVLPASTEGRPMNVVVSVYLYPADGPTTYSGAFLSGFTQSAGGKGRETKIDYIVDPDRRPSYVSTSGRVTSVPGKYEFRMALFAQVPGHSDPHQFQQVIPVEVAAPRTT